MFGYGVKTMESHATIPGSTPLLEFRNITVYRGDNVALNDLSLTIPAGQHVAIIGPNGSGKSTLIRTIMRYNHPVKRYKPVMKIFGRSDWHIQNMRELLAIVSSEMVRACSRDATGRSVVLSGFFSSFELWPQHTVSPEMEARGEEVMRLMEAEHLRDKPVNEMSSGEAKRMVIGRALVNKPRALLLDEPSNSLDLRSIAELRETLRKIAATGTSLIVVTHHLPDILPEVSRIILLKDGKVFADGAKEELLTSATLSNVFGLPVEVIKQAGYYNCW